MNPQLPPMPQEEFVSGPEITEAEDPSPQDEASCIKKFIIRTHYAINCLGLIFLCFMQRTPEVLAGNIYITGFYQIVKIVLFCYFVSKKSI